MEKSIVYKENNKERGLLNDSYQNNTRRFLEKIISFFMDLFNNNLKNPDEREQRLIDELRKNTLDFSYDSKGSKAEDEWMKHAERVSKLIQVDDPRRFLTWNPIKDTMGGSNYLFVIPELKYLKTRPDWHDKWRKALLEDKIGNQTPFFLYPKSSGNLIHHAYIVANLEEKTEKKVDNVDFVFDFGGGYGSVCRLIHRLGFKGKYLIYDISVFSQIQIFFLKSIGLPVLSFEEFKKADSGICCISSLDQLKEYFSENKMISDSNSLFIAMWSISESPISTRKPIMDFLNLFNIFIIGYQDMFGEVDNREYFREIKNNRNNVTWHERPLKHLPRHNLLLGSLSES